MKLDGIAHDIQGDGEWLLMIIGIGAPRQSWSLQIDDLAQRFRCITFDNPGIGESDGLPGSPTTADLAATAARLLGLLGVERAHVLGVSMGGAIVQQLALDHPALVDRAAIVCSWAACDDYLTRCFEIMRDIAASHDGAGWSVPVQRFLSLIGFAQASFTERFEIVAAIEKAVAEATEAGREELAATFVAQANACLGHDTRAPADNQGAMPDPGRRGRPVHAGPSFARSGGRDPGRHLRRDERLRPRDVLRARGRVQPADC
jgi:pimeloyl-ACP methyl ester carboxylesterase